MTVPLFFVDDIALTADFITVDGDEGRHAADVRRLRAGEVVDVGDGRGHLARGVVTDVQRGRIVVQVDERFEVAMPRPRFVVAQALAKGGRDLDAVEATWIPAIAAPACVDDVRVLLRDARLAVVLHEEATQPLADVELPADGDVVIVVGPEGGLSVDELAAFEDAGAGAYRLGNTVLRTSTAGVAALSVLRAKRRWR